MVIWKYCLRFQPCDFRYTRLIDGRELPSFLHIFEADEKQIPYGVCLINRDNVVFLSDFLSDVLMLLYSLPLNSLAENRYSFSIIDLFDIFKNRFSKENFIELFPLLVEALRKIDSFKVIEEMSIFNDDFYWKIDQLNFLKAWHFYVCNDMFFNISPCRVDINVLGLKFSDSVELSDSLSLADNNCISYSRLIFKTEETNVSINKKDSVYGYEF